MPRPTGTVAPMEFRRINALPPYAFAAIDALKVQLRRAGEDVIDLAFGNPDVPSPAIAVEKLAEAVRNPRNHRYSTSRGIPKLRLAVADLYERTFGVTLDFETEVCSTIGAKEGFSHLMLTLVGPGDTALVPSPSYPIHIWGPILAGAGVHYVRMGPDQDFFANLRAAYEQAWPRPRVIVTSFPHNPTTACVDLDFMTELVEFARDREIVVVHDFAYADLGFDGYQPPSILQVPGRERRRGRALHAHQVVLDGGVAYGLPRRQCRDRRRARQAQVVPRLRVVPAHPDRGHRRDERGSRLPEGSQRRSIAAGATR